ncbi:MAG TPA: beta-N-acetylhexosaminidase [Bryobacteraceae bacterium]|nr:beta-N-acetylhexosaminidase [Bryobacteraceae bacterium]
MRFSTTVLPCAVAALSVLHAEHNRLLPAPQQISYSAGKLAVEGLQIRFASAPSAEDLFVAREIAAAFAGILRHPVAIGEPGRDVRAIRLVRDGDGAPLPGKEETTGPVSRESYALRVAQDGAEIRAKSTAGLFYGAQTLIQLVEGGGAESFLPAVEITDWPSLAYRGVMMDLSHGPMPTVEEIERQIDFLARFKANQYYFYSELTIELKGYPLINPGARYSQDEVRRIIDYGRERHVDVVPCLEFYGHLHDAFRLERYADFSPLPHGGEINPRNPKLMSMLNDWVAQMAGLFPSPWFHVGLDEPWELERAGSSAAGGVAPAKLYQDHLSEMARLLRSHDKRMMFWADVSAGAALFDRYPELASELPEGVIAVPWHYRAEKSYQHMLEPFAKARVPVVIGTGIWGWQDISPDFELTFSNIDGFLADGRKRNILGVVNTNWSDDAQILFRATLPAMSYAAAAAWQAAPMDREHFYEDYAARIYPAAAAPEMSIALKSLAQAQADALHALGYETRFRLWDDPLYPSRLERMQTRVDLLRKMRLEAEDAQEHLDKALALSHDTYTIPSLLVGARLMDYAGMKFLYAAELAEIFAKRLGPHPTRSDVGFWLNTQGSSRDHGRFADLMDAIKGIEDDYRSAWLAEYTPYRMGTALGRFDAEYEYWRRLQANFWEFEHAFKDQDALPPLDAFRPWGFKR